MVFVMICYIGISSILISVLCIHINNQLYSSLIPIIPDILIPLKKAKAEHTGRVNWRANAASVSSSVIIHAPHVRGLSGFKLK